MDLPLMGPRLNGTGTPGLHTPITVNHTHDDLRGIRDDSRLNSASTH
jgi:hypothetical protein